MQIPVEIAVPVSDNLNVSGTCLNNVLVIVIKKKDKETQTQVGGLPMLFMWSAGPK